jgi:RNase P subunit RPR2
MATAEAYCVKCKKTRKVEGAKKVKTKNGRNAIKGTCPKCGTKMFKFTA